MIKIVNIKECGRDDVFIRKQEEFNVTDAVAAIIAEVRAGGDKAVLDCTERFDKVRPENLRVTPEEIDAAMARIPAEVIATMEEAAERIKAFHRPQVRTSYTQTYDGIVLTEQIIPLQCVGLYVPGGTAAYPSTVLMNAVPAKLAGVEDLVMVSPPTCNGNISPVILAAAKVAGVDKIFKVGGAQAVAALAYGTESIPRADKIVGPGNAFVAEAKKQVYGVCGIDMIAGPSEILVVADENSDPAIIAADMLSQAEHDKLASAVLVTTSEDLAYKVGEELDRQLPLLPRAEIASASIENNGKILIAETIEEAIELANDIAPEHFELFVDNPFDVMNLVKNAGSVFMGKNCPEALGDYFAGPNHTLPTSGTARFSSPLSVDDFIKKTQFTYFTPEALSQVSDKVALFARQEGLEAHARSAESRFKK